jgi:hypothetical protein
MFAKSNGFTSIPNCTTIFGELQPSRKLLTLYEDIAASFH